MPTETNEESGARSILLRLTRGLINSVKTETDETRMQDFVPFPYQLTAQGISLEGRETDRNTGKFNLI